MNLDGKDFSEWYFVREGLEKGVEAQATGEVTPDGPSGNGAGGTTWRDSRFDCFLSSAEVTTERLARLGSKPVAHCAEEETA
jgi:hypothetical protein